MDKSQATRSRGLDEGSLAIPAHIAHHVADEEHVVLLEDPGNFDLLRRKDDFLAEGVAAVFGLAGAKAELLALCFQVKKFTLAEAVKWLAERGFVPLLCVSNSDE
jgi:hypothetical protein